MATPPAMISRIPRASSHPQWAPRGAAASKGAVADMAGMVLAPVSGRWKLCHDGLPRGKLTLPLAAPPHSFARAQQLKLTAHPLALGTG